jgi:ferric-dicitrate binding protein FerR (iron transport regulator)
MRNENAGEKTFPSQYQVKEISSRGMPVPPTYAEAQALLDSFEPTPAQQKRLDEIGLSAATRGEAKQVIADFVAENPEVAAQWEAENAKNRVARRQAQRGEADPTVTTAGMYKLLAESGVQNVPTDYATAAAMIDELPPSDNMARVLKDHGRAVPGTRAEATEIIRGLPATPDQIVTIMRRTGGRWAPKTRGEAERWFNTNPRNRDASEPAAMEAAA